MTDKRLKLALMGALPLMFASAVSSHSRGALLIMGVLIPLLLWHSKQKYLAIPVLVVGLVAAVQVLPEEWFARMHTIESYEHDRSAMARILTWRDGIAYAFCNPLTGAGLNGWAWVTSTQLDWHSAYVEALAEHGFVGFLLWCSLLYGTMLSLPRLTRKIPEMQWVANYAYMLRASLAAYATGSLFLGITYWDLLYHRVFISVLVKKFALEDLAQDKSQAMSGPNRPAMALGPLRPLER